MKRKMIFSIVVLLVFGFSSFSCFAQSANDQRIVGTWVHDLRENETLTLVFNANGSVSVAADTSGINFTYGISITGEIKIRGSTFNINHILFSYDEKTLYFSPDGRTLILGRDVYKKR